MRSLISLVLVIALACAVPARAQDASQGAENAANNPLTPEVTINLQDYFVPSALGVPGGSNQFLLRGLIPIGTFGGIGQLARFTVPIATTPALPTGRETAVGDVTLTDFFVLPGKITFAGGPVLVLPSRNDLSLGRWQAGAAGLVVAPQSWGLLAALVIYQHSFAAAFGHDEVSHLTFQPIVTYNLPQGFYLRSSGIWTFDLVHAVSFIPVGFGLGKVVKFGDKITMNAFVEPQYSIAKSGVGAPRWQIFGGVNFQFAIGK